MENPAKQEVQVGNSFYSPKKSAAFAVSPAIPVVSSSPSSQTFFYPKQSAEGKEFGYTPNRENTISLKQHEGHSHLRTKDLLTGMVVSSDSPLKTNCSSLEEKHKIRVMLKALLSRADSDYHFALKGTIDPNHYQAMHTKISEFMHILTDVISRLDDVNLEQLLIILNSDIKSGKAYNPFRLKMLYPDSNPKNYNLKLAAKIEQLFEPITLKQVRIIKKAQGKKPSGNSTPLSRCLFDGLQSTKACPKKAIVDAEKPIENETAAVRGLYDGLPPAKATATMASIDAQNQIEHETAAVRGLYS